MAKQLDSGQAESSCNCSGGCGEPVQIGRRELIKLAGGGAAALLIPNWPVMAGPFVDADFARLIPTDKKLSSAWVAGLTSRGEPEVYRGDALNRIGMPVGGLFCGTVYLAGDGRLWLWDIFNSNQPGILGHEVQYRGITLHHKMGSSYVEPVVVDKYRVFDQGFTISVKSASGKVVRPLDQTGFSDVSFVGQYPIGTVRYADPAVPVSVSLEAFSPFIPLNVDDSSLPATVLCFHVENKASESVEIELTGLLESAACKTAQLWSGSRFSVVERGIGITTLKHAVRPAAIKANSRPASDKAVDAIEPRKQPDFGNMCLALLGTPAEIDSGKAEVSVNEKLVGTLGRRVNIEAGKSADITFVIAWYFPNLTIKKVVENQRHYVTRFADAAEVAHYISKHFDRLAGQTRLWRDTWYDSTLPFWFLDRTFANTSSLATTTCHRFSNGRFWAWEGVGCCPGTCTHVWHYAQALARLFPEIERDQRERVDFGLALDNNGTIRLRAEHNPIFAIDGQAGRILGAYREHQMSVDGAFLKRIWPGVRKATQRMMDADPKKNGLLWGPLHNTLDADWFGCVPWLCSMYYAALRAAEQMAIEVGDADFAATCRKILDVAAKKLDETCWNEDFQYYIHRGDEAHAKEIGAYDGCHIDQVLGQGWAHQVGLGDVMTPSHVKAALKSIWKYNFTPDVGPFRDVNKTGGWYAMAGDGGTIMVSFPFKQARQFAGIGAWSAKYFNTCMTGFEHQVASHMIWDGLVTEGLAVTRAIHDRYNGKLRNPYNQVECSDHYARSMASYGTFLAACGFECHGPNGHIGFAPRLTPDDFKAPFTSAGAWGTFQQKRQGDSLHATIEVKFGRLRLRTLGLALPAGAIAERVEVRIGRKSAQAVVEARPSGVLVRLKSEAVINAGEKIEAGLIIHA